VVWPHEGMLEIKDRLVKSGVKVGLVSNIGEFHRDYLR
jgi:hypothetical protein